MTDASRSSSNPDSDQSRTMRGDARFWRVSLALFLSGLATFAVLYCVQPLMPVFAADFRLSPAAASLTLSVATGAMAFAMFGAGALSDVYGRKRVMAVSLIAAALVTLIAALAPNWPTLVALRTLTGVLLAGAPAVAMAYLAEEMDASAVGLSMGLFIAGNTVGGLGGRLVTAWIAETEGWRGALGTVGAASLAAAVAFAFALPQERRATSKAALVAIWPAIRMHLAEPGMRLLFALGFLLMGSMVTTYNYIGFRLAGPPFLLSQTTIGFVFVIYVLGMVASTVAGDLAGRFGRRRVILPAVALMPLGALTMLTGNLAVTILGVALVTIGFFAGHSIASSWIGLRAPTARAQASALYLFFYYMGSSLAGSAGGVALAAGGWPGVVGFVGALALLALAVAARLKRAPPPAHLVQPPPKPVEIPSSG
jgi:YNFM family putative membrane transporter